MNPQAQQAQYIAELHQFAQQCSAYLSSTHAGAISLSMRHRSIYAMRSLSQALQNEQAITTNLQLQLNFAMARINQQADELRRSYAEVNRLVAVVREKDRDIGQLRKDVEDTVALVDEAAEKAARDSEERARLDALAAEVFEQQQSESEKKMKSLVESYSLALVLSHQEYEERLAVAEQKAADAIAAKRKANLMVRGTLDFAVRQGEVLQWFMSSQYKIEDFKIEAIKELMIEMQRDPDFSFDDNLVTMFSTMLIGENGGAVQAEHLAEAKDDATTIAAGEEAAAPNRAEPSET